MNNIIKRRTDKTILNIIKEMTLNKNLNSKNLKNKNFENKEIFELNMLYYNNFIDYINYKIKCYELTIDYINDKNIKSYDIKKMISYNECLNNIKNVIFDNQQEGYIFKKTLENLKESYKEFNIKEILLFDNNEEWNILEPKILKEIELDDFKIRKKFYSKSKKINYPKNH